MNTDGYFASNLFSLDEASDDRYTGAIKIPQYEPSAICPSIYELFNDKKYRQLLSNIRTNSNLSEDEKLFLELAATRHIVFNYSKIADYYSHASKDMQELMEQSALVIIDIDDAIANGYVKLSRNIENIMRKTGRVSVSDKYTEEDFRNGNPYSND